MVLKFLSFCFHFFFIHLFSFFFFWFCFLGFEGRCIKYLWWVRSNLSDLRCTGYFILESQKLVYSSPSPRHKSGLTKFIRGDIYIYTNLRYCDIYYFHPSFWTKDGVVTNTIKLFNLFEPFDSFTVKRLRRSFLRLLTMY